jgi:transposase-like protein
MSLKDILLQNWGKNEFISLSLNTKIKNEILQQTSFLDKYYSKIQLRNRAYTIIHNITEENLPQCKSNCGKPVALDLTNAIQGFREYCGSECSRKDKTISKDILKNLKDKNWLYDQRIIQQKSIEFIGKELGISHVPVQKWIRHHKIDDMIDGRKRNSTANIVLQNKSQLQQFYDSGLTCEEIAEKITSTKSTVSRWLRYYEIEIRSSNSYERKVNKVSLEEQSLYNFISSIYDKDIQCSNRSILSGQELDIYIPDKNIAIEYNGLYSHSYKPWESKSSLIKDSKYHLNKTNKCKEQGIQLIHLYSDEWLLKRKIVESVIKSKLNLNQKIYARKCNIIQIDTHTKNIFLNQYHMQGEDKSKIKLGLIYENDLMCVMTFTHSRFNKKYQWELSRFCTKSDYNVVGGFSKLLTYFRKFNIGSIISYADLRYSDGNVYQKNGFDLIHINSPSYYYVDKGYLKRYNRMGFQRKYIGAYDCTEYEKARELGYNKIFDCGTLAFGLE